MASDPEHGSAKQGLSGGTPFDYLGKLTLADWSNKGIAAQLGAPGVAVPAPFVTGKLKIRSGSLDRPEGVKEAAFAGWAMFTGTSFAAAVAAGCIAGTVSGKCPPSPERLVAAVLE